MVIATKWRAGCDRSQGESGLWHGGTERKRVHPGMPVTGRVLALYRLRVRQTAAPAMSRTQPIQETDRKREEALRDQRRSYFLRGGRGCIAWIRQISRISRASA